MKITILFTLMMIAVTAVQAQNTLQKLKFEEAEKAYNAENYTVALAKLEELEKAGLQNPRILHLKILATSKIPVENLSMTRLQQVEKEIELYLEKYDIEGLEEKYREVYDARNTLVYARRGEEYLKKGDIPNAIQWFETSGTSGLKGLYDIGISYRDGTNGLQKNEEEALKWILKAADGGGLAEANETMGHIYLYGSLGIKKDEKKALSYFEKAIEIGNDGELMCYLGNYFSRKSDVTKGLEWYAKAMEEGHACGYLKTADIYSENSGGKHPYDPDEAIRLYKIAIDLGEPLAFSGLGYVYLRAKKDGFYALEYLKKGYKEYIKLNLFDDAMVCTHGIGDIYHYGRGGVTVNKQEAIKWHELTLELYPKSDAKKDGFPFLKNSSEASLKKLRGL